MKKFYEVPNVEFIEIETEDILNMSLEGGDDEVIVPPRPGRPGETPRA